MNKQTSEHLPSFVLELLRQDGRTGIFVLKNLEENIGASFAEGGIYQITPCTRTQNIGETSNRQHYAYPELPSPPMAGMLTAVYMQGRMTYLQFAMIESAGLGKIKQLLKRLGIKVKPKYPDYPFYSRVRFIGMARDDRKENNQQSKSTIIETSLDSLRRKR